jgi:hypothetical protein
MLFQLGIIFPFDLSAKTLVSSFQGDPISQTEDILNILTSQTEAYRDEYIQNDLLNDPLLLIRCLVLSIERDYEDLAKNIMKYCCSADISTIIYYCLKSAYFKVYTKLCQYCRDNIVHIDNLDKLHLLVNVLNYCEKSSKTMLGKTTKYDTQKYVKVLLDTGYAESIILKIIKILSNTNQFSLVELIIDCFMCNLSEKSMAAIMDMVLISRDKNLFQKILGRLYISVNVWYTIVNRRKYDDLVVYALLGTINDPKIIDALCLKSCQDNNFVVIAKIMKISPNIAPRVLKHAISYNCRDIILYLGTLKIDDPDNIFSAKERMTLLMYMKKYNQPMYHYYNQLYLAKALNSDNMFDYLDVILEPYYMSDN